MACLNCSTLELIKIIVIMITADEESNMAVARIPTIRLLNVVEVNFCIPLLIFSLMASFISSERLFIENKKRTRPAISDNTISKYI